MKILGFDITRAPRTTKSYPVPVGSGGWWPIWPNVPESFTGAWQQNATTATETILSNSAVGACISLIIGDIAKTRLRLVQMDSNGVWTETESAAFSPVLRNPNGFQNRIQFIKQWLISKLVHGNTYVLKVRDQRRVVTSLYVLDPTRVRVVISPDGSVFYALSPDPLEQVDSSLVIPAREIIHDRMATLYHPLVGVSPIHSAAMAAIQGLRIQSNSTRFFTNGSNPGGVLSAPGQISPDAAQRLKDYWETNFTGENMGKIAVLGDGLKYEPMFVNAHDSQLIEQLKWTAETICTCFHVPPYMIGVGQAPTYNNIEALNAQYYAQCLQILIEELELALDEGLELPKPYGTEFDLDDLLRMDTATLVQTEKNAGGLKTVNESRNRLGFPSVPGGDTVFRQQQDFSLEELRRRAEAPPVTAALPPAEPDPEDDPPPEDDAVDEETRALELWQQKHATLVEAA